MSVNQQWREGMIIEDPSSSSLSFDADSWNDTEILEIFDAAIKSHRTKSSRGKSKSSESGKSKENRGSTKNVHFATGQDEDIVSALGDETQQGVSDSWRRGETVAGQWTSSSASTSRLPRVNFDLSENNGPAQVDSNTHTDTEGSDCGSIPGFGERDHSAGSQIPSRTSAPRMSATSNPPERQIPCPPMPFPGAPEAADHSRTRPVTQTEQSAGNSAVSGDMEAALADMLMAWYQSGYATGRYYAMLEQQQQQWQAYYQQQQFYGTASSLSNSQDATKK